MFSKSRWDEDHSAQVAQNQRRQTERRGHQQPAQTPPDDRKSGLDLRRSGPREPGLSCGGCPELPPEARPVSRAGPHHPSRPHPTTQEVNLFFKTLTVPNCKVNS